MSKYTARKKLTPEEFENIKDGTFVQVRVPKKPTSPINMNVGPIYSTTTHTGDKFKKIDLLGRHGGSGKGFEFILNKNDYETGSFEICKLASSLPIHQLIEGMKIEAAVDLLKKQIGNEICIFVPDPPPSLNEEDTESLASPHIVKDVFVDLDKICIRLQYNTLNGLPNKFVYAIPNSTEIVHLYIYAGLYQDQEPKNNQGRESCYWCGNKTEKVSGIMSFYNVCPRCKK